jgi:hypothetical protein
MNTLGCSQDLKDYAKDQITGVVKGPFGKNSNELSEQEIARRAAKDAAQKAREKVLTPEGNLVNDVGWSMDNVKENPKGAFDTMYKAFMKYFNENVGLEGAFHKLMQPTSNQKSTSEPDGAGWTDDGH